jgi:hypothetical protein
LTCACYSAGSCQAEPAAPDHNLGIGLSYGWWDQ